MVDKYVFDLLKASYKGAGDERGRHRDPNIHVSDLYKVCPRSYALCHRQDIPFRKKMFVGMQLGYIFDMGNYIQEILNEKFSKMEVLFGTFECLHCGHKETRFQQKDDSGKDWCSNCNGPALRYIDTVMMLKWGKLTIVGSVDTFLRADPTSNVIFPNECKSIKSAKDKSDGFEGLTEPQRDHRYQISLYMWLLRQRGVKLLHKPNAVKIQVAKNIGAVTYAIKGNAKVPFKVYQVVPDEAFLIGVEKNLNAMDKFLTSGRLPRKICKEQSNLMARDCAARTMCFKQ